MLVGCRPGKPSSASRPGDQAVAIFDAVPYAKGPLPAQTQLFLVAGGDDIANFAQEVVEQRALWEGAGVAPSSIACYWAQPSDDAYMEDGTQFDDLVEDMRACRRATPPVLHADLAATAKAPPPWVYVYVTGHGLPPLLRWGARTKDVAEAAAHFDATVQEAARLDQPAIGLQAGPAPRLEEPRRMLAQLRDGASLPEVVLSPVTLSETLQRFPADTVKIVVLQACFSGGFVGTPDERSALAGVDNLVLLTATAHDRPSFGCGAGSATTYWGGAVGKVLQRYVGDGVRPPDLDWVRVHEEVAFVVDVMESIDGESPSAPSFFSNVGGDVVMR